MRTLSLSPDAYLAVLAHLMRQWNACGTVGRGPNGGEGATDHGMPYRGTALVGNVPVRSDVTGERLY
jgi:hypothetical protein